MRTAVNKLFDDFVKNGGGFIRRLPPPWGIPDKSGWEPIVELRDREASDRPSHLYVLIHGTFAADETVFGNRWWQASHAFVDVAISQRRYGIQQGLGLCETPQNHLKYLKQTV